MVESKEFKRRDTVEEDSVWVHNEVDSPLLLKPEPVN